MQNRHSLQIAFLVLVMIAGGLFSGLVQASTAPDFTLPTRHGSVHLKSLRGHVVLVDFWASWCGPCRESFPWMNRLMDRFQDRGLKIVAINLDQNSGAAQQFLAQVPADFTVAFDPRGKTPNAYGVMGMPSSYLIGPDGRIRAKHIGFHGDRVAAYESAIAKLLQTTGKD